MQTYGITDKGKVRKDNQDYYSIIRCKSKSCYIVALCDGMGGESGGEIASELSNNMFTTYVNSKLTSRVNKNPDVKKVLIDACYDANKMAYDYSLFDPSLNGMGTTIVGGVVSDIGVCRLVNVGDSRAYHLSFMKESIYQITRDHSLVENLIESGVLSKDQAKNHPQKNIITRAIGSEETVEPDYFETVLNEGDMLLLCSDGLSNFVSEEEMLQEFIINSNPESFCKNMLELTFERGAYDNVTLIAVVNR